MLTKDGHMADSEIKGVVVPILTPLTLEEEVDKVSMRRLVNYLVEGGVHGIWAAGTTGEFASLTMEQHVVAIETVVEEVAGRVPVIGNISAASTEVTVRIGLAVRDIGLTGVAATPPFYFPNAQDELLDHYRRIKDRVGLPLWVYNIPVTVKTAVEPATVSRLAGEGTIVGTKDSSGAGELLAELNLLCEQAGTELYRFLGTLYRISSARSVGAHGVIPGIANLVPAAVSAAWQAGESGDAEGARRHDSEILSANRVTRLAKGGGPNGSVLSGLKSSLKVLGVLDNDHVGRPLRPLTQEEKAAIPSILADLGLRA